MKRNLLVAAIILSVFFFLTGCWDRRELNELGTVVGMAIDTTDDGMYLVTIQVVDPGETAAKAGAGSRIPVVSYESKSRTISEAVRKMTMVTAREIYFSHLQMLIIGEKVAKKGLGESLDYFYRERQFRPDFFIVLSIGTKAANVLKILTPLEKIPSQKLHRSLEISQKTLAQTYRVRLYELISNMTNKGKAPVLTGVRIIGDEKIGKTKSNVEMVDAASRLEYEGLAILKKDKLVGWLNEKESKGWSYITGNVQRTLEYIPCSKKDRLVIEVMRTKADVNGKVIQGKPNITINLTIEANIVEVRCDVDISKTKSITELEEHSKKVNIEILKDSITKAQKLKTDIFGFGQAIYEADPIAWKQLKGNWDEVFSHLPITIKSKVHIRRTGTVNKSFLENIRE